MRRLFVLCPLLFACASATVAPEAAGPKEAPPLGKLGDDARPLAYTLELKVDPAAKGFSGSERIEVELKRPRSAIWLHARGLNVSRAQAVIDGATVEGKLEQVSPEGVSRLVLPREVGPGKVELRFEWEAAYSEGTGGLFVSREAGESYAATQLEAIDARRVFPSFDEPRFKTPFTLSLVVPAAQQAIGNTHAEGEEAADGGFKRVRFARSEALPTYLVAAAVGPFELVERDLPANELRSRPLHVRWLAPKGRAGELAFAQSAGDATLLELEKYFGIAFPYDKLDHVAVPGSGGAMENAGLIRYAEQIILYQEGASSPAGKRGMVSTIVHEMAHQWFGDYVTTPWWDEIWLNEAFATWMAARVLERWDPKLGAGVAQERSGIATMYEDSLASVRRIREPIESVGDIDNAFDSITYQKGAAVIGMFERYAGEDAFQRGLQSYLKAHAHGSGSTAELLAAWSRASGKEMSAPFSTFLDQPGVPLVEVSVQCDGQGARALLQQSRYVPLGSTAPREQKWGLPFCARFSEGGKVHEACTLLDGAQGTLALPACPEWVMPNAGGNGYYRWALAPKDLAALRAASGKLSVRERLSLADSVSAALAAGALPIADALEVAKTLAADPDGEVAVVPMALYKEIVDSFTPSEERPRARELARAAYAPRLAELGWDGAPGDSQARQRLRQQVISFLAWTARDPAVRAEAKRRGLSLVAPEPPELDRAAVAPGLASIALGVAAQDGDAAFFEKLMKRLAVTQREDDRGRVLGALGAVTDPALADRVLALSLGKELRATERARPVFQQIFQVETREHAWEWLRVHWDELVKALDTGILSPASYLPTVSAAFCDDAKLEEARAFFAPRVEKVEGAARPFKLALEEARACAAQSGAHRVGLANVLGAQPSAGR